MLCGAGLWQAAADAAAVAGAIPGSRVGRARGRGGDGRGVPGIGGNGRGRARGFNHSEAVRERIRAGALRRRLATVQESHAELLDATSVPFARKVVEEAFGEPPGTAAVSRPTAERVLVAGSSLVLEVRTADARDSYLNRALEAHAAQQARGLARLLTDGREDSRGVMAAVSYSTSDDASMWMAQPKGASDPMNLETLVKSSDVTRQSQERSKPACACAEQLRANPC